MTRPQAGKVVASLAPMTRRAVMIAAKPLVAAVSAVAADQMAMPPPTMRFAPIRSTSTPRGTRHTT